MIWFGGFYGISTLVGYLMPNPLYTYILNVYDLVWLGFMACKPLRVRVFTNGPEDLGSIPGRVIPKTQKWHLILPYLTLSNIRYVSRVKWSNSGKE